MQNSNQAQINSEAERHFLDLAVQYYVAARSAVLAGLVPVCGNLFHHALEMFFKAWLSRSHSLKTLASKKKFGHDLEKLWAAFKAEFPDAGFEQFDGLVSDIHPFEDLRYPESIMAKGAQIHVMFVKNPAGPLRMDQTTTPRYELDVPEVDKLVARIFVACSKNPMFFMGHLTSVGREAVMKHNPMSDDWFGRKADPEGAPGPAGTP